MRRVTLLMLAAVSVPLLAACGSTARPATSTGLLG